MSLEEAEEFYKLKAQVSYEGSDMENILVLYLFFSFDQYNHFFPLTF